MGGIVTAPEALAAFVGREFVSDWENVGQERIDGFAEATGDRQWVHVDAPRAKAESPFGATVAHGYLLVSLIGPAMLGGLFAEARFSAVLNYGLNRVRFLGPVREGARVRVRTRLESAEAKTSGTLLTTAHTLEIAGDARPAMRAEALWLGLS